MITPAQSLYYEACARASDINELLPCLFALARGTKAQHITEMGVRDGQSTRAWLAAAPKKLICYDINPCPSWPALEAAKGDTELKFIKADVRLVEIEPTEILFIDTWHVYEQLRCELNLHANKVSGFIALHDTTTFGERGEDGGKGLWPAVQHFVETNPQWRVYVRHVHNNGLTILERRGT